MCQLASLFAASTAWSDSSRVPLPTGVFAKQGTWIEALTTIVGAAGGYLLPHPSDKILRVRHRYPVVPWDWWTDVTPDFVLPVDTVGRESLRWIDKPAYNERVAFTCIGAGRNAVRFKQRLNPYYVAAALPKYRNQGLDAL